MLSWKKKKNSNQVLTGLIGSWVDLLDHSNQFWIGPLYLDNIWYFGSDYFSKKISSLITLLDYRLDHYT